MNRGDNRTMLVWLNKEVSTVGLQQGEMKYMDSIGKISASSVASGNAISEQAVCDGKVATSSADFSGEMGLYSCGEWKRATIDVRF